MANLRRINNFDHFWYQAIYQARIATAMMLLMQKKHLEKLAIADLTRLSLAIVEQLHITVARMREATV